MATLYVDLENGNDNYAGSSFAVLAEGTNGRISSTTFSSAGASFPNDGSLIGQYLSIFNGTIYAVYNITAWVSSTSLTIAAITGGTALANQAVDRQYYIGGRWKSLTSGATAVRIAPGDEVRMMGSPAPTSLGQNGVWTSQVLQATKVVSTSTNATPISVTVTAHGYSTGDTVVINGVTGNTNANGTWEITVTGANTFTLDGSVGNGSHSGGAAVRLRNNTRVMLTTAVTQNIASTGPGRAAWVPSTNALTVLNAGAGTKEGYYMDQVTVQTAFTTGKAAYYTLPSTLDLSGYQQVSFWVQIGTLTSGQAELRLCSDTVGDTAVNTIAIPSIPAISRWQAVTVDLATNLGSSINSIALYVTSDLSTSANVALYFSNIIACKASSAADSLTLTSLIGKNTTGETFWGIQSINGRRVMLDADTNATPTSTTVRGYYGTSETVTTWKRETIKLGPAAGSTTALQTIQDSGTDGSPITFSGGWDRTNMSTQNLETWLDGVNGNGYGIATSSKLFVNYLTLAFVRMSSGIDVPNTSAYNDFNLVHIGNCTGGQAFYALCTIELLFYAANGSNLNFGSSGNYRQINVKLGKVISNSSLGVDVFGGETIIGASSLPTTIANHSTYGFTLKGVCYLRDVTTVANGSGGITYSSSSEYTRAYLSNCLISETTEAIATQAYVPGAVFSQNHDQTTGNHKIFIDSALISAATDQRKTASGISWKIQPTSTNRNSAWPVTLSLAKVACAANSLVTVKAWMRRDNSGLTMRLVCKGGQIAGVPSDVTASVTTTNAWEEETITFTPTETGVVEITAQAWGGTTFSGWVDDLTISQA